MFHFYTFILFVTFINAAYQNKVKSPDKFIYDISETKYVFRTSGSVELNCGNINNDKTMWFKPPQFHIFTGSKLTINSITNLDYGAYYCASGATTNEVLNVKKVILMAKKSKQKERSIEEEIKFIENVMPKGREINYVSEEVKDTSDNVIWEHPPGTILLKQGREFNIQSYNVNHTESFFYYRINRKGDYLINKVGKIFISEWKDKKVQVFVEGVVSYGAKIKITCIPFSDIGNDTKVIWRKNDKIIFRGYTYIIKKYQEESFGNYSCEIEKKGGIINKGNLNLIPKKDSERKIEIKEEGKFYDFNFGKMKQLHCKLLRGAGKKKYTTKDIIWTFRGEIVVVTNPKVSKGFERRDTKSESILSIKNMDQNKEGTYKCFQGFTVFTVHLVMSRSNILLKVSPDVETVSENVSDSVEFSCEINSPGITSNMIKWSFRPKIILDEIALPKEAKISSPSIIMSLLIIENVLKKHEGIYVCEVLSTKVFGTLLVKSNFVSTVKPHFLGPSKILKHFCQGSNLNKNESLTYACDLNSRMEALAGDIEILKIKSGQMSENIKKKVTKEIKEMKQQSFEKNKITEKLSKEIKEMKQHNFEKNKITEQLTKEIKEMKQHNFEKNRQLGVSSLKIESDIQSMKEQTKIIKDEMGILKKEINKCVKKNELIFTGQSRDYWGALNLCKSRGLSLLRIDNEEFNTYCYKKALEKKAIKFWIDGTDIANEGNWVHTDNQPLRYTNWAPGQPDNLGGEHCLEVWEKGLWNDNVCGWVNHVICMT